MSYSVLYSSVVCCPIFCLYCSSLSYSWQFLLPVKYICVECSVGSISCLAVSYIVLFCTVLWYRLVSCVTFSCHLPKIQILENCFADDIKVIFLSYILLSYTLLSYDVVWCSMLFCFDGYTVCKTALR